jgi:hypothetical protein
LTETATKSAEVRYVGRGKYGRSGTITAFLHGKAQDTDEIIITSAKARATYLKGLLKKKKGFKTHGDDLREQLEEQAAEVAAKAAESEQEEEGCEDGGGYIVGNERQLPEITRDATNALLESNIPTPKIFAMGSSLSRVIQDCDETTRRTFVRSDLLTPSTLLNMMARCATWKEVTKKGLVDSPPPKNVAVDLLSQPEYPFPRLRGIVTAPFVSYDGRIVTTPGYDAGSELWHDATITSMQPVSASPSSDEIDTAVAYLKEPIREFPFVSDADVAHSLATSLVLFARELIAGPLPLFAFGAPSPGTGKDLLLAVCLYPYLGYTISTGTAPDDRDEWRKTITSVLSYGSPVHVFGNADKKIDNPSLAQVLTSSNFTDRQLGLNKILRLFNRTLWVTTGNNLQYSTEIRRRRVPVNIDAGVDRPEDRTGFAIPNVIEWSKQNRSRQVWACLTIIQAWLSAGKPQGKISMASFEPFAHVMGGILNVAGVPGFLTNLTDNPLKCWMATETFIGPDEFVSKAEALESCNRYLSDRKLATYTRQNFKSALSEILKNMGESQRRIEGVQTEVYTGIGLKRGSAGMLSGEMGVSSGTDMDGCLTLNQAVDGGLEQTSGTSGTLCTPNVSCEVLQNAHLRTHAFEQGGEVPYVPDTPDEREAGVL